MVRALNADMGLRHRCYACSIALAGIQIHAHPVHPTKAASSTISAMAGQCRVGDECGDKRRHVVCLLVQAIPLAHGTWLAALHVVNDTHACLRSLRLTIDGALTILLRLFSVAVSLCLCLTACLLFLLSCQNQSSVSAMSQRSALRRFCPSAHPEDAQLV